MLGGLGLRFFVFFIILTLSIVSIYVITVVGKSQAGNQLSLVVWTRSEIKLDVENPWLLDAFPGAL